MVNATTSQDVGFSAGICPAAAFREIKEETGLESIVSEVLAVRGENDNGRWSIEIIAKGKVLSGEFQLDHEHKEYRYVNRRELLAVEPKGQHLTALTASQDFS